MRIRTVLGLTATAGIAAALWWRKNPSACPYGQRFWVEAPHPIITRDRLRTVLRPAPGERVLEIGPGTGYYTLDMAEWVGDGSVEIFDLQQEFLDHVMHRAAAAGERGPHQGDATALPKDDASIDAVVLTAVLGEIPDPVAALPRDPPSPPSPPAALWSASCSATPTSRTLRHPPGAKPSEAGLTLEERSGNWFGYFARLTPG